MVPHEHPTPDEQHDHQHAQAPSEHPPFSVEHWEERYGGEQMWSGNPNGALVAEVSALTPGRALDIGCGEGADAVWLAQHGWQVTALDIAANAVRRTETAAQAAGVQVTGLVGAFDDAALTPGAFDLVSAMYPVLPRTGATAVEPRLLDLVAPGGTLLFVHHADMGDHAHDRGFDLSEVVMPEDVLHELQACGWEIQTHDRRDRSVASGAGSGHHADLVIRAQRPA